MLKTIFTFNYSSEVVLHMGLQLNLQLFKKPYLVECET